MTSGSFSPGTGPYKSPQVSFEQRNEIAATCRSRPREGVRLPDLPTNAEALRLGGNRLAADGVALIGEHGDYTLNEKGQILYPRYDFYRQIVDVMRQEARAARIVAGALF